MSLNARLVAAIAESLPVPVLSVQPLPLDGPADVKWPTVSGSVDALFDGFDSDANGTIETSEIAKLLHPDRPSPALTGIVAEVVALIDADGNQKLDAAEVTAAVARLDTNHDNVLSPADLGSVLAHRGLTPMLPLLLQGGPFVLPDPRTPIAPLPDPPRAPTLAEVTATLLTRFDADDDGTLKLSELLAVLDPSSRRDKLQTALASLVDAVDSNDDQLLSASEISAAVAGLDSDGNGSLDPRDHLPGPPELPTEIDLIGLLLPRLREFNITSLGQFD